MPYIVRVSSAPVRGKARRFSDRYVRIGLLEVDEGVERVGAIDARAGKIAYAAALAERDKLNAVESRRAMGAFDAC